MTDTGQIPGEGLPENAGMVEQPGVPASGAYTFLDSSENGSEEDDLLLMPGAQGAWSDPHVVQPVQGPVAHAPVAQAPVAQMQVAHAPVAPAGTGQAPVAMPVPERHVAQPVTAVAEAVAQTPGQEHFVPQEQFVPQYRAPEAEAHGAAQPPAGPEFPAPDFAAAAPVPEPVAPAFAEEQFAPVEQPVAEPVAAAAQPAVAAYGMHEAGAHEAGGRDSGSVDLNGVRIPPTSATPTPPPARRPLHMGPPVPDASSGGVVRSLADRGPAGTPAHATPVPDPGPPTSGPEYLDIPREETAAVLPGPQLGEIPPQAGVPWDPQPQPPHTPPPAAAEATPETVVPEPEPEPAPVEATTPVPVVPPATPVTDVPVVAPEPPVAPESADQGPEPEPEAAPLVEEVAVVEEAAVAAATEEPAPQAEVLVPAPRAGEPGPVTEKTAAEPPVQPVPEAEPVVAEEVAEIAEEVVVAEEAVPAPKPEPVPAAVPETVAVAEEVAVPEAVTKPEAVAVPEAVTKPEAAPAGTALGGAPAPGYDDAEREAVLRVMRERRDIRNGFRSDPIPHEVLLRVLEAAHTAPSVGHSQPWDFVVIRSAETRRTMHELAQRQRDAYAKSLPKGRAKQFKELKIEAILDTPVNIVVTADPTRGGRHTLGRHTQPQMAPYSSALAVENLWLAARAEGLGVGWVSFFDEREMVRALGLPEHLEAVAYLCVGYVDEFPEEPELMQAGWSKRRPLSWVVHEETYGRRALPGEEPHDLLQETVSNIRPLDAKALGEAWERQKRMTKPAGALGMLEIISAQLSGLSRMCPPPIPEPAAVAIFAGDHGVHAQGVTAWPQEVTAQMVANFLGGGAVCNAFANQVGAEVCVIDVGVAADLPATPGLLPRKVRAGTADCTTGPALSREDVLSAVEVGIETARDLVAAGNKALLTGEMGIANTTISAALISVYTGIDPSEITGRGTGINDEMHARKVDVVRRALELHAPDPADPIGVLSAVGGLEHAALVGFILGGASLRTPVVLDGVSAGAAALVARAIAPEALAACIAGHRSAEPGHVAALNKLGLRPLVDLDLRLGEGTGALLALPVVQSAARAMHEVATFDSAGVTEK
ncbi:nicotinate-nucleotide--dimethylbenzimidazole phosphoribosyltransferase [Streptomyces sp. CA-135486]|uniref:nicotinate-nucleotide--dimethylbenzimidazole phosphoribosyltransferase n=1 Tax=Streptomyces sp. CA-135486 TaxID=3240049 RepID=UPI003D8C0016